MNIWKSTFLIASITIAIVIGTFVHLGWIGSIVFGTFSILLLITPWGGNGLDLLVTILNTYRKGRKLDEKEEAEVIEMTNKHESHMGTVAVMLSGGVDSAVTAHLLKEQGYKVKAFFMRNWNPKYANELNHVTQLMKASGMEIGDGEIKCQATIDLEWAQKVADHLNIELVEVDFVKEYWDKVFSKFLEGLKKGITPNPDILCNSKIKFGEFYKYIKDNHSDQDYIATGHYASIKLKRGKYYMAEAHDDWKDQTYFLAEVDKEILPTIMFPLGNIPKDEVRLIAEEINLPNSKRKDSMGICFIGKRNFREFLSNYISENPGDIIDQDSGEIVGEHKNAVYYTIGQRGGLNIGGSEKPYYVVEKDVEKNIVYVVMGSDHPNLNKDYLSATKVKLLVEPEDFPTKSIEIKTRHSNIKNLANIKSLSQNEDGTYEMDIKITETIFGITPGQELVMYKNGICLGGGKIK